MVYWKTSKPEQLLAGGGGVLLWLTLASFTSGEESRVKSIFISSQTNTIQ